MIFTTSRRRTHSKHCTHTRTQRHVLHTFSENDLPLGFAAQKTFGKRSEKNAVRDCTDGRDPVTATVCVRTAPVRYALHVHVDYVKIANEKEKG